MNRAFTKKHAKITIITVLCILSLFFLLNFKVVIVNGDSMIPTFHDGQFLLAKRHFNEIKTGDIVVFHIDNEIFIKRVIGVPTDIILVDNKNGQILVNNTVVVDIIKQPTLENREYIISEDNHFLIKMIGYINVIVCFVYLLNMVINIVGK